jgi:hypothetical protein
VLEDGWALDAAAKEAELIALKPAEAIASPPGISHRAQAKPER